jgi:hypothetical protein
VHVVGVEKNESPAALTRGTLGVKESGKEENG